MLSDDSIRSTDNCKDCGLDGSDTDSTSRPLGTIIRSLVVSSFLKISRNSYILLYPLIWGTEDDGGIASREDLDAPMLGNEAHKNKTLRWNTWAARGDFGWI